MSLCLALAAALVLATPQDDGRDSLEDLLERARARQAALVAKLGPEVKRVIARVESADFDADEGARDQALAELRGLGPDATPLLVGYLEVGATGAGAKQRAALVAEVLRSMPTSAITDELLRIAEEGSERARHLALGVLAETEDTLRVSRRLIAMYEAREDRTRYAALEALGSIGGPENLAYLVGVLDSEDDSAVGTALGCLADAAHAEAADRVLVLLNTDGAEVHARTLLRYYLAGPELATDEVVGALLRLTARQGTSASDRQRLLDKIPGFGRRYERAWEDALAPLVDKGGSAREEALICLARLGSPSAKRDLLNAYNDLIDEDEGWYQAWVNRGNLYMRLEEYRLAARDFERALDIHRGPALIARDIWIALARAHVRDGNLRQAHKTLEAAKIPPRDRVELAEDPDFRPLVEHGNYGKYFR